MLAKLVIVGEVALHCKIGRGGRLERQTCFHERGQGGHFLAQIVMALLKRTSDSNNLGQIAFFLKKFLDLLRDRYLFLEKLLSLLRDCGLMTAKGLSLIHDQGSQLTTDFTTHGRHDEKSRNQAT